VVSEGDKMNKRQLIDEIVSLNNTARPAFLATFEEDQLNDYLRQLNRIRQPRLTGDSSRFARYFQPAGAVAAQAQDQPALEIVQQSDQELLAERTALLAPVEASTVEYEDEPIVLDETESAAGDDCRDTRWRTGPVQEPAPHHAAQDDEWPQGEQRLF